MSSSRDDIGSEQNKQQKQTPPIREHHDCTVIGRCKPHFQNLALPFLSQYPEYPRGAALPLMTCLKDPPPTNNTLIKLHFRTLGRILHPDKYSGYVKKSGPPPKSYVIDFFFLFLNSLCRFDTWSYIYTLCQSGTLSSTLPVYLSGTSLTHSSDQDFAH